jgi:rhodanese-related sulfurtransferase
MKKRIGDRRCLGWLFVAMLALGVGGCQSEKTSDRDLSYVNPTEGMTLAQGKKKLLGLGGEASGAWIDPRGEREYIAGHIPGAIHVPFGKLETLYATLEGYDVVIVYGEDYNSAIAQAMSKALIQRGHTDVRTLKGGLRAWRDAGCEVEQGR